MEGGPDVAIRALSVCAGIGGLDLGWRLASGGRTVCYVERDAYAASVLVARMASQALDEAPVWSDLLTLPCGLLRGYVDGVIGGIPCQPYSAAGKGLGADDGRDLWPATFRILQELGSQWLFLENVGRFASNPDGLRRVLKDLASLGWNAEWGVFSCGALGAPHRRERIFILAYANGFPLRLKSGGGVWPGWQGPAEPGHPLAGLGHTGSVSGRPHKTAGDIAHGEDPGWKEGHYRPEQPSERLADAYCSRLEGARTIRIQSEEPQPANGLPFWPPGQDPRQWGGIPNELHPAAPKHDLRRVADGVPDWVVESNRYRVDRFRCLGNAVSPPVAAVAWHVLCGRAISRPTGG